MFSSFINSGSFTYTCFVLKAFEFIFKAKLDMWPLRPWLFGHLKKYEYLYLSQSEYWLAYYLNTIIRNFEYLLKICVYIETVEEPI